MEVLMQCLDELDDLWATTALLLAPARAALPGLAATAISVLLGFAALLG